jgi:hypothetical protein
MTCIRSAPAATFLTLALVAFAAGAAISDSPGLDALSDLGIGPVRPGEERSRAAVDVPLKGGTPYTATRGATSATNAGEAQTLAARWLVEHQAPDGGWGAGAFGVDRVGSSSDVATSALAVLALVRDRGSTERHRESILKGIGYIVKVVEESPAEGPRLKVPEGTQPQYKLGQYVDTHMAAMMLSELAGRFDGDTNRNMDRALDRVLLKVQAAQQADGSFDANGWAPILSNSIAMQSLEKAAELGKQVPQEVLARADDYNQRQVDVSSGRVETLTGAGVQLYGAATAFSTNRLSSLRSKGSGGAKSKAAAETAKRAVTSNVGTMMSGFGSVGGEEMLSWMMISDALAADGGDDWKSWEDRIGKHLTAIQNADGSWSGHHCITSTTFVTAAALMTLGADDALAVKVQATGSPVETGPATPTGTKFAPVPPAGAVGG